MADPHLVVLINLEISEYIIEAIFEAMDSITLEIIVYIIRGLGYRFKGNSIIITLNPLFDEIFQIVLRTSLDLLNEIEIVSYSNK